MKLYAGIGSRETPAAVLALMQRIGENMARAGFTLRSGAAPGADSAFEAGCDAAKGAKEIYLPWRRFNNHTSLLNSVTDEALIMAAKYHPAWTRCSPAATKLHARNCYQILGADLATPVRLVICWTRDAAGQGGTGQALRIARAHSITIHDLGIPAILEAYSKKAITDLVAR